MTDIVNVRDTQAKTREQIITFTPFPPTSGTFQFSYKGSTTSAIPYTDLLTNAWIFAIRNEIAAQDELNFHWWDEGGPDETEEGVIVVYNDDINFGDEDVEQLEVINNSMDAQAFGPANLTDLILFNSQAPRAGNILNTHIGTLEYAQDLGIDLDFFLSDEFKFQNESFKAYLIEVLANRGINVASLVDTVETLFRQYTFNIAPDETGTGLIAR